MSGAHDLASAGLASLSVLPDQSGWIIPMPGSQTGHRINGGTVIACDHDRFAPSGEHITPRVLWFIRRAIETFQLHQPRSQAPEARLMEPDQTPGGFHIRKGVQSLAHPQFAAR